MAESAQSQTSKRVSDYVQEHFYAEYLEGLKGKRR